MKIAVLSRNPRLYSTRRLVEAGTERGHEMVVVDTLRAYMNIASHKPQIHSPRQTAGRFRCRDPLHWCVGLMVAQCCASLK
jgi:glutathione synthase/RimK-type ligase-like ATP-grasp enzyme